MLHPYFIEHEYLLHLGRNEVPRKRGQWFTQSTSKHRFIESDHCSIGEQLEYKKHLYVLKNILKINQIIASLSMNESHASTHKTSTVSLR